MAELKPVYVDPLNPGRLYEPKANDDIINNEVVIVSDIPALRLVESSKYKIVEHGIVLNKSTNTIAFYELDRSDQVTVDDGETVIVDADGGRWKIKKNLNRAQTSIADAGKIERVKPDGSGWFNVEKEVDSFASLINVNIVNLSDSANINVNNFYSNDVGGGGLFFWDSSEDKGNHNGGTIIDPDHSAIPGNTGWWAAENIGAGCWKRVLKGEPWSVRWFGAKGDGVADDTTAIQKALDEAQANLTHGQVYVPNGIYLISTTLYIKSGISLAGPSSAPESRGASFIPAAGWTAGNYMLANDFLRSGGDPFLTWTRIEQLRFDGNGIGGVKGVNIGNASNFFEIRGVAFDQLTEALYFSGTQISCNLEDIAIYGNGATNPIGIVFDNIGTQVHCYNLLADGINTLVSVNNGGGALAMTFIGTRFENALTTTDAVFEFTDVTGGYANILGGTFDASNLAGVVSDAIRYNRTVGGDYLKINVEGVSIVNYTNLFNQNDTFGALSFVVEDDFSGVTLSAVQANYKQYVGGQGGYIMQNNVSNFGTEFDGTIGLIQQINTSNYHVLYALSRLQLRGSTDVAFQINRFGTALAFYGSAPVGQPSLTYSRTGETTAESQLRQALATLGLVADNSTA